MAVSIDQTWQQRGAIECQYWLTSFRRHVAGRRHGGDAASVDTHRAVAEWRGGNGQYPARSQQHAESPSVE
jgi:hypothetical protein